MNKKGWLRIFEAVIAILLIMGAILLIYTSQREEVNEGRYIMDWQEEILNRIAENDSLRSAVVGETYGPIETFISSSLLPNLNFSIKICGLTGQCSMEFYVEEDIFVQERIISGTIETYNPKRIRFFVWKKK